jgi:hypothetical protein
MRVHKDARLRAVGFELRAQRPCLPPALLIRACPLNETLASPLDDKAGKAFVKELAARWNAVSDALTALEKRTSTDGDKAWRATAENVLLPLLRRAVNGEG